MTVREFLERYGYTADGKRNTQLTFIVAEEFKATSHPGYDTYYRTTPVRAIWEWITSPLMDEWIMVNENHPPIDSTNVWHRWHKSGMLCFMVQKKEDVYKHYNEKQAAEMIEYWEEEIIARMKK